MDFEEKVVVIGYGTAGKTALKNLIKNYNVNIVEDMITEELIEYVNAKKSDISDEISVCEIENMDDCIDFGAKKNKKGKKLKNWEISKFPRKKK